MGVDRATYRSHGIRLNSKWQYPLFLYPTVHLQANDVHYSMLGPGNVVVITFFLQDSDDVTYYCYDIVEDPDDMSD